MACAYHGPALVRLTVMSGHCADSFLQPLVSYHLILNGSVILPRLVRISLLAPASILIPKGVLPTIRVASGF